MHDRCQRSHKRSCKLHIQAMNTAKRAVGTMNNGNRATSTMSGVAGAVKGSRNHMEQGRRCYMEPVDSPFPHHEHRRYSVRGHPPDHHSCSPSHGDHGDFENYPPSSSCSCSYQSPEHSATLFNRRSHPASSQPTSTSQERDQYRTPPCRNSIPEDHGPSTSDAWESILGPRPGGDRAQPPPP